QHLMGLTDPLGGLVHAGEIHRSPHTLSIGDYHSPAIEFEVAVLIGGDVPVSLEPYTIDTIAPYAAAVSASFEIIDTRGGDLAAIGAAGLVADRCLCSGMVVGDGVRDTAGLDLGSCPVELVWNDEIVETGIAGAAMGHPFAGLAWVANHVQDRGRSLVAGHHVLTGSAFAPRPVSVGDAITYRIEGVGEATIEVVA
ncbi:MAG: hypothetical protein OEV40_05125, partial [Acidimicrobiia bacterium]|nr:hypothetical protein [Acidimicrobiia bacterium]